LRTLPLGRYKVSILQLLHSADEDNDGPPMKCRLVLQVLKDKVIIIYALSIDVERTVEKMTYAN